MENFLYIDATSGGIALQMLLGGAVGGLVIIKLFWRNTIGSLFGRRRDDADQDTPDPPGDTPEALSDTLPAPYSEGSDSTPS
jgi:hypothetical protein